MVSPGVDPRAPSELQISFRFLSDSLERRRVLPPRLREQTIRALEQDDPLGLLPYLDKEFQTRYTAVSWFGVPTTTDTPVSAIKTSNLIWKSTIEYGLNIYPTHDLSEQATAFWDEAAKLVAGSLTRFVRYAEKHKDIPPSSIFHCPLQERKPAIADRIFALLLSE